MKIRAAGDDVAEPFLQCADRVVVAGPDLFEELVPALRGGGFGVVCERYLDKVE